MLSGIKPYAAYKSSHVHWVGSIPAHWEVRRGGWLFRKMDRPVRDADEVVTCFRDGTVTLRKNRRTEGFTNSLKEIGYQGVRTGDLVIHQMDAFAGAVGVSDSDGKGTPVYSVCHAAPHADSFYFAHVVREMARSQWISALAKGIRERSTDFRYSDFARQYLPLPPMSEQRVIVRYLDYVERRIHRYVAAKRKLIALLEEEKQAIINEAVTRGLDPNVRIKPSGVEWLGDVPEHWKVRKSKRLFSPRRELARPNDVQLSATQAYGVIPQDEYERRIGRRIVKISLHLDKRRHVEVDDFVISMRSFQGGLERAWATGCIRSSYVVLCPATEVDVEFFSYVFKSQSYIKALQSTANFIRDGQDLNFNNFHAVDLPFPPAEEQRKIATTLAKAAAGIDAVLAYTRRQIALLEEYRTRLTADVVTGKLDVREAASQLPEDTDDREPIEESSLLSGEMREAPDYTEESIDELAIQREVIA